MKKWTAGLGPLAAGLVVVLSGAMAAAGPEPPEWSREFEVKVPISDRSRASEQALTKAKIKAVESYLDSRVPGSILAANPEARDRVMAKADRYVVSWEVIEEKEEGGVFVLRAKISLDRDQLDATLKAERLLPVRALPPVFLMVPCQAGEETMPSAWENPSGIGNARNPCEDAIKSELNRYGIPVLEPKKGMPKLDLTRVMNPKDEAEKREVFRELQDKFGAGVMVVGRARLEPGTEGSRQKLTLMIAAADLAGEQLLFSENLEREVEIRGAEDRDPALATICQKAGQKTVASVFSAWLQKSAKGEPRAVAVVVQNLESYSQMKEVEARLKAEGPGVTTVELSRAGAGSFEFSVITTADVGELAQWLEDTPIQGKNLKVVDLKPDRINAFRE